MVSTRFKYRLNVKLAPIVFLSALIVSQLSWWPKNDVLSNTEQIESYDHNEAVCFTKECFRQIGKQIARAFEYKPMSMWCKPSNYSLSRHPVGHGLILVKVPKAGSSTAAGVALRIHNNTNCPTQWTHRLGVNYAKRSKASFLFAPIRLPGPRAISSIQFFVLEPKNLKPNGTIIIQHLNSKRGETFSQGKGGYQYNYVSLSPIEKWSANDPEHPGVVKNTPSLIQNVQTILQQYDMLLVTERMDESLVAMALIAGLPLQHVLVASAKVSSKEGSFRLQRFGPKKGWCRVLQKVPISPELERYLQSEEWVSLNYADFVLYHAANASLDLTIDRIGRSRFDRELKQYLKLKDTVVEACGERLGMGCTSSGEPIVPWEPCYDRDFGCGYQCIDDVLRSLNVST